MTRILALLAVICISGPALAADAAKVLVASFAEISDDTKRDWVGRAIQQSLVAELSRLPIVTPISAKPEVGVIDDVEESVRAAKGAGTPYVVFGAYQLVEQELRV